MTNTWKNGVDPTLLVHLPDGRRLAYAEYGDPQGHPTLCCDGPCAISAICHDTLPDAAQEVAMG